MRRRILTSMIAMLLAVGALLGIPLSVIAWWWVSDSVHQDLDQRLRSISGQLARSADPAGRIRSEQLTADTFRLMVPEGAQLEVTYADPSGATRRTEVGESVDGAAMTDTLAMGTDATLSLRLPMTQVRGDQFAALGIVAAVVAGSVAAGTVVAAVTAGRIADPLTDLADRAAAMARGDFRSRWKTYGIDELDRMSRALGDANTEIAQRLEREGEIVGDVSHQLRSRLTAVQLRLDELSMHPDEAVVAEAEAGLDQIDRLTSELDEMVAASRDDTSAPQRILAGELVTTLVGDFDNAFAAEGRRLRASLHDRSWPVQARAGRLREAVSVLVDNALHHGRGDCRIDVGELAGDMVRITVSDEGDGVPDRIVPDIFRRGFSASSGPGHGVGLSLARALVEADGGRLDLTSRQPATFAIVVRAADGGPAGVAGPADVAGPPPTRDRVPHR